MYTRRTTNDSETKPKGVILKKGGRVWFIMKVVETVLVLICLLLLILTHYLYVVVDDFTSFRNKNDTINPYTPVHAEHANNTYSLSDSTDNTQIPLKNNIIQKLIHDSKTLPQVLTPARFKDEHLESELRNWDAHIRNNETLKRVKKICQTDSKQNTTISSSRAVSLNDLLIMFPCATTLFMVIAMEILGELFKDPLSRLSTLILIGLSIILAFTLFIVSLLANVRNPHVTLILTTILSTFLVIVETVNFVLLILS